MSETILFYFFAGIAIAASMLVIGQRNPMYSIMLLIASFGALSALYIQLDAPFVAMAQIIVYAGAIMVLFLFVVMLLNAPREDVPSPYGPAYVTLTTGPRKAFALLSVILLVELALAIRQFVSAQAPSGPLAAEHVSSVRQIGIAIFTTYSLAFEATSVLILVGIVGGLLMAAREEDR